MNKFQVIYILKHIRVLYFCNTRPICKWTSIIFTEKNLYPYTWTYSDTDRTAAAACSKNYISRIFKTEEKVFNQLKLEKLQW